MGNLSLTEQLIYTVDELYASQTGPFGRILCDEALSKWQEKHPTQHYIHLSYYFDLLIRELPDYKSKVVFIDSLRDNEDITSRQILQTCLEKF